VHRLLLAVFAGLAVFLLAAASPFTIVPTVVVYPLLANASAVDSNAITQIETLLATQIGQGGKVKITQPTPGVDRQHFLADARSLGADYYVTGFITPLGDGASVIEQVVSTISGIVVFSVSAQITTYAEVADQGDQLREGILERASRGIIAFQASPPPPAPSATPAPRPPKPTSAAAATPPPLDATVAILTVGGSADADQRAAAAQALAASFGRDGRHAIVVSAVAPSNDVCVANNATALVAGWLDTQGGSPTDASASLRLVAYDCTGKVSFDRSFHTHDTGPQAAQLALAGASDAAVGAFVNPPKRSR
jgi:hypothetical protein